MPGELFVEYQLAAQNMRPNEFVTMAAYGDYGPGDIGTKNGLRPGRLRNRSCLKSGAQSRELPDGLNRTAVGIASMKLSIWITFNLWVVELAKSFGDARFG